MVESWVRIGDSGDEKSTQETLNKVNQNNDNQEEKLCNVEELDT